MATAEAVGALLSSLGATGSLLCLSSHKKEKRQGKILGAFCRLSLRIIEQVHRGL